MKAKTALTTIAVGLVLSYSGAAAAQMWPKGSVPAGWLQQPALPPSTSAGPSRISIVPDDGTPEVTVEAVERTNEYSFSVRRWTGWATIGGEDEQRRFVCVAPCTTVLPEGGARLRFDAPGRVPEYFSYSAQSGPSEIGVRLAPAWQRILGWSSLFVGAALGGLGPSLVSMSTGASPELERLDRQRYDSMWSWGWALSIGGAALLVTGIVLLIAESSSSGVERREPASRRAGGPLSPLTGARAGSW